MACRPQYRELHKKLQQAKQALMSHQGLFANPSKAVGELNALDIGDSTEIWGFIVKLLDEVTPDDYVGGKPPHRSYERRIEGQELFAFSWWSEVAKKQMYLKFALRDRKYYYVSLHKDTAQQKKEVLKHEMLAV